jgi:hypothetical protein
MTHPSKRKGYALEVDAAKALANLFPRLKRTGSVAYTLNAPDLVQDGAGVPLRLIVTRDKGQPILVTMSVADLDRLADHRPAPWHVVVQCKKRESTWIGRLWRELKAATS